MKLVEVIGMLKAAKNFEEINYKRNEIAELIPDISRMFGYDQSNYAHPYDLWEHSVQTALNLEKHIDDDMLYLAALLHDIGKPDCRIAGTKPEDTNIHYYGHPRRSMEIVRDRIIPKLGEKGEILSDDDKRRLLYYVEYHDDRVSLRLKHLRRHLNLGIELEEFKKLMLLQVADAKAHAMLPIVEERIRICTILSGEYADDLYERIVNGE